MHLFILLSKFLLKSSPFTMLCGVHYSDLAVPTYVRAPGWHSGKKEIHVPVQEMPETRVRSLGQKDPLAYEMTTLSSILAWKIPWIEDPGGLQSMGSQRVEHD